MSTIFLLSNKDFYDLFEIKELYKNVSLFNKFNQKCKQFANTSIDKVCILIRLLNIYSLSASILLDSFKGLRSLL